jgi:hypothetical protein
VEQGSHLLEGLAEPFSVVGYSKDGFAQLAQAVDEVLGEQMKRFAGAL